MSDETGRTRATELFQAIAAGDSARVTGLIHQDQALAAARDERGLSPVLFALYHQHRDMAELLAAHVPGLDALEAAALGDTASLIQMIDGNSASVDDQSADGFTMLHLAAFFNHPETVRALLDRGADPDAAAANGTCLRPIHAAAAAGSVEIVTMLLEAGADADARQHGGWTALHAAAKHGLTDMVRILIAHAADQTLKADDGSTPVDLARTSGHQHIEALMKE